jgi:membrane protein implicated in regulation of membrane protease activity
MWQIWLIIAGLFFIGEILTVGFLIFWLGIGALIAMFVSLATSSVIIQTSVFVISSGLLILITQPFIQKFVDIRSIKTNAYSVIGKRCLVIKDIDSINSTGQVKINGEVWSALSDDEELIKEGTYVEIVDIKGVKVIVKPIPDEQNA